MRKIALCDYDSGDITAILTVADDVYNEQIEELIGLGKAVAWYWLDGDDADVDDDVKEEYKDEVYNNGCCDWDFVRECLCKHLGDKVEIFEPDYDDIIEW